MEIRKKQEKQAVFMGRCLQLAGNGLGQVSPNPMVGAVIVQAGRIIGEGWHRSYGGPHAEVNAINQVLEKYADGKERLKEAVMFVSLEPCAHQGKTPSCANLIVQYEIPEVVIGCVDPYEKVAGKGIERLRAAGIKIEIGVLEAACMEMNRRFITFHTHKRPYIILKWAQTRNGYFAPSDGSRHWITGSTSRQLVHRWRSEEDAIMVGYRTALADDPELTVRQWSGKNPLRIVVDKNLALPPSLKLFDQSEKTLVFNASKTDVVGVVHYLEVENFDYYFPQFSLYQLYLMDVQSLIIEGGARTLQMFIDSDLWDEARIFIGPSDLRHGISAPQLYGTLEKQQQTGPDQLFVYRNDRQRHFLKFDRNFEKGS